MAYPFHTVECVPAGDLGNPPTLYSILMVNSNWCAYCKCQATQTWSNLTLKDSRQKKNGNIVRFDGQGAFLGPRVEDYQSCLVMRGHAEELASCERQPRAAMTVSDS
ncbi:hypothetical protein BaRGS_00002267 [Batillaria attramentaria]|uniref:Uncharacterized protein n=1 Tax=Batillaria attramentaria TaxID=370345 RepID=A0ABD0M588_9CAEN